MYKLGLDPMKIGSFYFLAETERFELSVSCPTLAFQASALDRYATSPIFFYNRKIVPHSLRAW